MVFMGHTPFNHLWMESRLILQFGYCELVYILIISWRFIVQA